ncbi:MAG: hypothetical protein RLZZ450_1865, partial [Pseudomonadota bacterium]
MTNSRLRYAGGRVASALMVCGQLACSSQDSSAADSSVVVVRDAAIREAAAPVVDAGATVPFDASSGDGGIAATPDCVEPEAGLPSDVFCTGLYKGRDSTQHADDAMAYTPG